MATVTNPNHPGESQEWRELDAAGKALGVALQSYVMLESGDLSEILASIVRDRAEAVILVPGPRTNDARHLLGDFGIKPRLPVVAGWSEYVEAGSLLSYGPSRRDVSPRLAAFVDRLMKGERAADLPVERPTRFDLAVNLKTARSFGVTIPSSLLLQADQIIE